MVSPLFGPMEIIPAIDLLDGACVRLHQGDYDQVTRFSDDPVAQALSWQSQGSQAASSRRSGWCASGASPRMMLR
jgi:phosphoribosylformimino-5-aminoimidazole carboxamide ribotide isomerase